MQALELRRKLFHLTGLAVPVGFVWLGDTPMFIILGIGVACALTGQILQVRSVWFNRKIDEIFGSMMRSTERRDVGDSVTLNGATWMAIAAFFTFLCFPQPVSTAAFSIAVVSDTAAALVGIQYGTHYVGTTSKTVEGSAAFVVSGLLVVAVVPDLSFWIGAAAVLGASAVEAYSTFINDNLLVPFTSGPIMVVLQVLV